MKIGVIHDSLNFAGGAERVALQTIEALKENGHRIVLGTIAGSDWAKIESVFGAHPTGFEEVYLTQFGGRSFRIYGSLLSPIILKSLRKICDFTVCTNGELMLLGSNISYMHYLPICFREDLGKNPHAPSDLYFQPFRLIQKHLVNRLRNSSLISNSHFTQSALRKLLNRDSEIVYPSVDLSDYLTLRTSRRKSSLVVTVGRYSPEKNHEFVLSVAQHLPNVSFIIIGTFSGANSISYYRRLLSLIRERKLKNVTLLPNAPYSKLISTLKMANIFLSPSINEHFGLTVVEAMAAGLVPVIHRSGGPWIDMLGQMEGVFGYSYRDVGEAVDTIVNILSDQMVVTNISSRNLERVQMFSDSVFKSRIVDVISKTL